MANRGGAPASRLGGTRRALCAPLSERPMHLRPPLRRHRGRVCAGVAHVPPAARSRPPRCRAGEPAGVAPGRRVPFADRPSQPRDHRRLGRDNRSRTAGDASCGVGSGHPRSAQAAASAVGGVRGVPLRSDLLQSSREILTGSVGATHITAGRSTAQRVALPYSHAWPNPCYSPLQFEICTGATIGVPTTSCIS